MSGPYNPTSSKPVSIKRRLQRIASGFNAKARRYRVPGVTTAEHLALMPGKCHYCGVLLTLDGGTWDHVIPFHRGGSNELSNIVRCCTSCQRRKFTKTPEEYAEHQSMMSRCALPGCDNTWQPRYAERKRGMARYCSRSHAAQSRWVE